ncbi:MAG: SPASM domain-containing protein [Candidatus Electrothrix communis]|nr:MAG: SPASM domain-containing protein [Candidatus Electrothrix communis]
MSKNGKDYYSDITKSLKKINKIKNFHCAARATVTKKSIPDFYQKVIKPFDEFRIKHYIFALANALNNDISLSTEEAIENAREQVYFCFKDIVHGGRIKNITVLQYMEYLLSNSVKEISCGVGKSYIAICYDGSIVPCHRGVNNKNISIGNIWDGLDEDKIQLYENATVTHRKECQKCPVRYFCKAHCCHYSLTSLGCINRVDSLSCAFHKTFIYETYKLFFNLKESNPNAYNKVLKQVFDNIHVSDKKNDLIFIKKINPLDSIEKTVRRNCTFGKNSLVEVIDFGRGGILFIDNEPIKKYFANTVTMAIWDTINGALTAQEIAQKIACGCGGELTEIEEDIYQQLAFLREIGFIEEIKIYKQLDQQIVTIE